VGRLALIHLLGVVASGFVSVALATSLFFNLSPSASRVEVLRYLVISLVPMAALGPVLGPLLDRRVRDARRLVTLSNWARAACCVALVLTVDTAAFYVAAFALLVANKAFSVGRQAVLPELVADRARLIGANAGLARVGAAAGVIATAVGVGLTATVGVRRTLLAAGVVFLLAARQSARLGRRTDGRPQAAAPTTREPVRVDRRARAAAASFSLVRGAVAVWALGIAFAVRRDEVATAVLGIAAGAYSLGSFTGNIAAARLARGRCEEGVIAAAAAVATVAAALAALAPGVVALALSGALLGLAASTGRLAFDAVLQATSAPACRGRIYARLETWVQLAWALGAAAVVTAGIGVQAISSSVAMLLALAAIVGGWRQLRSWNPTFSRNPLATRPSFLVGNAPVVATAMAGAHLGAGLTATDHTVAAASSAGVNVNPG
jgi:MFS family permease